MPSTECRIRGVPAFSAANAAIGKKQNRKAILASRTALLYKPARRFSKLAVPPGYDQTWWTQLAVSARNAALRGAAPRCFSADTATEGGGSFSSSLRAGRLKVTVYSATEFSRTNQPPLHARQRFARLVSALAGEQDIVEVLPHVRMLLQVNDHRGLLAAAVDEELYSTHAATIERAGGGVQPRVGGPSTCFRSEPAPCLLDEIDRRDQLFSPHGRTG